MDNLPPHVLQQIMQMAAAGQLQGKTLVIDRGGLGSSTQTRKKTACGSEDTSRVAGLSNIQCKLLGPLFTHYQPSRKTGSSEAFQRTNSTPEGEQGHLPLHKVPNWAFRIDPTLLNAPGYGRDKRAADYLQILLHDIAAANEGVTVVAPLHADGDGHCLVHAVSRCIIGQELYWHALRTDLQHRLETDRGWYLETLPQLEEEWAEIVKEAGADFVPPPDSQMGLRPIHVFGLANALRRPIILFDGPLSRDGTAGVFLPFMHHPNDCKTRSPIAIAWASAAHDHFVALCPIDLPSTDTLKSLVLTDGNQACVALEPAFSPDQQTYACEVPSTTTSVLVHTAVGGRRSCWLPRRCLPQSDGVTCVWGASSIEQSGQLLEAYIEFFDRPEELGGPACKLGDGENKDLEKLGIVEIMERRFQEDHSFQTDFAREAFAGMETQRGGHYIQPVAAASVLKKAKAVRDMLYYCPICASSVIHTPTIVARCSGCGEMLMFLATLTVVNCPACTTKMHRKPFEQRPGEEMEDVVPTCDGCQNHEDLRAYSHAHGGFVLQPGDRTRTPTAQGCCGWKHAWVPPGSSKVLVLGKCPEDEYDFIPNETPLKLTCGSKTVDVTVPWIQGEADPTRNSDPNTVAVKVVTEAFPDKLEAELEPLIQSVKSELEQFSATVRRVLAPRMLKRQIETMRERILIECVVPLEESPEIAEERAKAQEEGRQNLSWEDAQSVQEAVGDVMQWLRQQGRDADLDMQLEQLRQIETAFFSPPQPVAAEAKPTIKPAVTIREASAPGSNMCSLVCGVNELHIDVGFGDSRKRTYTVTVVRQAKEQQAAAAAHPHRLGAAAGMRASSGARNAAAPSGAAVKVCFELPDRPRQTQEFAASTTLAALCEAASALVGSQEVELLSRTDRKKLEPNQTTLQDNNISGRVLIVVQLKAKAAVVETTTTSATVAGATADGGRFEMSSTTSRTTVSFADQPKRPSQFSRAMAQGSHDPPATAQRTMAMQDKADSSRRLLLALGGRKAMRPGGVLYEGARKQGFSPDSVYSFPHLPCLIFTYDEYNDELTEYLVSDDVMQAATYDEPAAPEPVEASPEPVDPWSTKGYTLGTAPPPQSAPMAIPDAVAVGVQRASQRVWRSESVEEDSPLHSMQRPSPGSVGEWVHSGGLVRSLSRENSREPSSDVDH